VRNKWRISGPFSPAEYLFCSQFCCACAFKFRFVGKIVCIHINSFDCRASDELAQNCELHVFLLNQIQSLI